MNLAELRKLVDSARPTRRALVVHDADRARVERALERLRGQGYDVDRLELRPSYATPAGVAYVIDLDALDRVAPTFEIDLT